MNNWETIVENYFNDGGLEHDFIEYLEENYSEHIESLKCEIDNWSHDMLKEAHNQLSYAGLEATDDFLKSVLKNNLDLAMETFSNGIGDTCQREQLIDMAIKEAGVSRRWPCNYEGKTVAYAFYEELIRKTTMRDCGLKYTP